MSLVISSMVSILPIFRYCQYCGVEIHISEWEAFISEWKYIFQGGDIYFGLARNSSERQHIISERPIIFQSGKHLFQSGNTYFRVEIYISDWQEIVRSGDIFL